MKWLKWFSLFAAIYSFCMIFVDLALGWYGWATVMAVCSFINGAIALWQWNRDRGQP